MLKLSSVESRAEESGNFLAAPAPAPEFFFQAAPAPAFSQGAPTPGIFFQAAPAPAPSGQKHALLTAPALNYWLSFANYFFPHKLLL